MTPFHESRSLDICLSAHAPISTQLSWGPFLEIPVNLPGPMSIFLNAVSPIKGMVLGQCFHRIIKI